MTRKLLFVNGLAIIGVILFHSVGMGFVAMFSWSHRYLPPGVPAMSQVGSASYYGLRLFEQIGNACIPTFLFVSGYFMAVAAGRSRATVSWQLVLSRIRSLLIPYLIWSAVVLALRVAEGGTVPLLEVPKILLTGSANEVLYFVPLLSQFYLLSPFIVSWAKKNWKSLLVVTAALQILVQLWHSPSSNGFTLPIGDGIQVSVSKWFFLARVFWFPLGVIVGLRLEIYKEIILPRKTWWLAATIVLLSAGFVEWEILYRRSGEAWLANIDTVLDSLYSLAVLFMLLAYDFEKRRGYAQICDIGARSFGIYLAHAVFIGYTARALYHLAPWILGYQFILQAILIAVGLGAPLAMMAITNGTPLRRWYAYLYG